MKALLGPFRGTDFLPTGGIRHDEVARVARSRRGRGRARLRPRARAARGGRPRRDRRARAVVVAEQVAAARRSMIVDAHAHVFLRADEAAARRSTSWRRREREAPVEDLLARHGRRRRRARRARAARHRGRLRRRGARATHPDRFAAVAVADAAAQGREPGRRSGGRARAAARGASPSTPCARSGSAIRARRCAESPMLPVLRAHGRRRAWCCGPTSPAISSGCSSSCPPPCPTSPSSSTTSASARTRCASTATGARRSTTRSRPAASIRCSGSPDHPAVRGHVLRASTRCRREEPPYRDLDEIVRALADAFGPQRMLWASDYPWTRDVPGYATLLAPRRAGAARRVGRRPGGDPRRHGARALPPPATRGGHLMPDARRARAADAALGHPRGHGPRLEHARPGHRPARRRAELRDARARARRRAPRARSRRDPLRRQRRHPRAAARRSRARSRRATACARSPSRSSCPPAVCRRSTPRSPPRSPRATRCSSPTRAGRTSRWRCSCCRRARSATRCTPTTASCPTSTSSTACVTDRTRALIVNFPSNPLGAVLPAELAERLCRFADAHDLWLISDECYDAITFGAEHVSPARYDEQDRVLSCFSFSKTYAMTGMRVGYLVAPARVAETAAKMQEPLIACVNAPAQYAALAALEGPQDFVEVMRRAYHERRDAAAAQLDARRGRLPAAPGRVLPVGRRARPLRRRRQARGRSSCCASGTSPWPPARRSGPGRGLGADLARDRHGGSARGAEAAGGVTGSGPGGQTTPNSSPTSTAIAAMTRNAASARIRRLGPGSNSRKAMGRGAM